MHHHTHLPHIAVIILHGPSLSYQTQFRYGREVLLTLFAAFA